MKLCSIMFPLATVVVLVCIHQTTFAKDNKSQAERDDNLENDVAEVDYLLDDMLLSKEQMDALFQASNRRNGLKDESLLWPNKTVNVFISDDFNEAQREKIMTTLEIITEETCVIVNILDSESSITDDIGYVNVTAGLGCSATVGYRPEIAAMHLNIEGCLDTGRILHEFLHILGFYHMHTTVNRDDFIDIQWENIMDDYLGNFISYAENVTMLETPYDFNSITHYNPTAFSKNGHKTIVSRDSESDHLMGQRVALSVGDILRINRLYECEA